MVALGSSSWGGGIHWVWPLVSLFVRRPLSRNLWGSPLWMNQRLCATRAEVPHIKVSAKRWAVPHVL